MRRVVVIGCSGAGKSTFARRLAEATGLPLVHLDAEFWQPGWQMTERSVWRERHAALTAGDAWILDGHFASTLEARLARADTVVWFDVPTLLCLFRVIRRVIGGYGRTRADMAPDCPERFDWAFLVWVATFRRTQRERIVAALAAAPETVTIHRFAGPADARTFLAGLAPCQSKNAHAQL